MVNFNILLVDDEQSQRETLSGFLRKKGYKVTTASSHSEAIENLKQFNIDLILTDYKMPGKSGQDVLKDAKEINPLIPVIIMTAYGTVENAVELMQTGAFDFIQKPVELPELLAVIEKARERQNLISENEMLKRELSEKYSFDSIIYQSSEMQEVLNTAARVADSKASVLIRGESGTGKELVAKAIHYASDRSNKPFVVVNCAAMPETLFESELFGHEKGSYTGASKQRIGKFEQAEKGTLFIDEVGDIPSQIQVKLLRAIQFGQIERLGGDEIIELDVRIISATNRNLEEMIEDGEFREDLYYRFNVVTINIPPLRNRKNDILPLIDFFINRYSKQNKKDIEGISKEALNNLMSYDFPGNVRELENIIQRAIVLTRDNLITQRDLPILNNKMNSKAGIFDETEIGDLNQKVEELETVLIKKALELTGGNQVKAGELLNISERTIRYKMSKYKI